MNLDNVDLAFANPGINSQQLGDIELQTGHKLPDEFRELLQAGDGFGLKNGVLIYSSGELIERNETFEVAKYAPGFIAIGDDSGGRAILVAFQKPGVFMVDHGSMDPADMEQIADSISDWVTRGCPVS